MGQRPTILIADRNRHVREHIRREMKAVGVEALLAGSGQEVLKFAYQSERLDLLILDPDLPGFDGLSLLEKIENRMPSLPVVLHGFSSDYATEGDFSSVVAFVEKDASSIDRLKRVVARLLGRADPDGTPQRAVTNHSAVLK